MLKDNKKDSINIEDNNINSNTLILSNSILLIPLVFVIVEALNRLPSVRLFTIIFGLILVGSLLVSNFLAMFANQLPKNIRKTLIFVAHLLSCSMYFLLFIFIMVIMIIM